jgi:AraC family transcriptional regulator
VSHITFGQVLRQQVVGDFRITETLHPALHRLEMHDHENPNINIVLNGGLQECVEKYSFECGPGSALLKPPGAKHSNKYGTLVARCIIVEQTTGDSGKADLGRSEVVLGKSPLIRALSLQLWNELKTQDFATTLILEGLALQLAGTLCRQRQAKETQSAPRWLTEAKELLDHEFSDHLTMRDIAARVCVDRGHLSAEFKRRFQLSPGEYLRRSRVLAAADLIRTGHAELRDIALECGFYDQSHFSRAFKRFLGITPGEFKRTTADKCTKNR